MLDRSEVGKRGYLKENFRLFHLRDSRAQKMEYHYHEFCKVLLLIQGSGGYFVDGQRYLLQSGDIVLLDAHSIHRPELDPDSPYERIILYISPDYLRQQSTANCSFVIRFSRSLPSMPPYSLQMFLFQTGLPVSASKQ